MKPSVSTTTAFPFASRKDIDLMRPVQDQIDGFNQTDRSRIGDWGVFPLCCGWAASQNLNRVGVMIEAIQLHRDAFLASVGHRPPVIFAMQFSSFLEEWCRSEYFINLATQRLRSLDRLTEDDIERKVPYFTLAILLNCLDSPNNEDIQGFRDWIAGHNSSWTELFFAVGVLKPEAFRLQRVASVLLSLQREPVREQFRALLQRYETMACAPA
jgi:hypothetical protein